MSDIGAVLTMKSREMRNRWSSFLRGSKLKVAVIALFSVLFWYALYAIFYASFRFVGSFQFVATDLIDALLYLFFFSLLLMLVFSNAIIFYSSFFREQESAFLLTIPMRTDNVFLYKFFETLAFSSWALLFLAAPLIAAYGVFLHQPPFFFLMSAVYFPFFVLIPALVGCALAFFFAICFPRTKRGFVIFLVVAASVFLLPILLRVFAIRGLNTYDYRLVKEIFDSIGFSRNPLLPNYWIAKGVIVSASAQWTSACFYLLLLGSTSLFLLSLLYTFADRLVVGGWHHAQRSRKTRTYRRRSVVDVVVSLMLFPLRRGVRLVAVKDLKCFFRDAVQWSQSLIFFGLLAIYFVNIRMFRYEERADLWKNMIAQMNLIATSLTMLTFISRFIFPQASIEGKKFWILGLAPMERRDILLGKLVVALLSSILIGVSLIVLSNVMLKTPFELAVLHLVTIVGVCVGLSGLAVGLGALYPQFSGDDNPSKIVSGFGGTLNLVLSLLFVLVAIGAQALPCYFYFSRRMIGAGEFPIYLIAAGAVILIVSLLVCWIPFTLGVRAYRRLEL